MGVLVCLHAHVHRDTDLSVAMCVWVRLVCSNCLVL